MRWDEAVAEEAVDGFCVGSVDDFEKFRSRCGWDAGPPGEAGARVWISFGLALAQLSRVHELPERTAEVVF